MAIAQSAAPETSARARPLQDDQQLPDGLDFIARQTLMKASPPVTFEEPWPPPTSGKTSTQHQYYEVVSDSEDDPTYAAHPRP
ncbi:hypothetical protein MY3296_010039 [Beauveria thailandica]